MIRWPVYLYGALGVVIIVLVAYMVGRCTSPDPPPDPDMPPDTLPTEEVVAFLPDPEPGFVERITTREVPVYTRGSAPIDSARVNEYIRRALASADSVVTAADTLPPLPPLLRIETRKERGVKVGVQFSDARYHVYDFPGCAHPCTVSSADTTLVARERREIPGLDLLKGAAICGVAAGVGAGVAYAAGFNHPEYAAAGAAVGCAAIKLTD